MGYDEFRRHLGKAGITVGEFAQLIDVQPSSVSNYAQKSSVPQTYAVIAVMLGDAADRKIDFRSLLRHFDVAKTTSKQPRRVARIDDYRKG